jgi:hypothetical protein
LVLIAATVRSAANVVDAIPALIPGLRRGLVNPIPSPTVTHPGPETTWDW